MKKVFFPFFGLLTLLATPAYSQWVLLTQVQQTSVQEVDILDFATTDYDDYIFVVDEVAPANQNYDLLLQVGYDDGVNPITWFNSYLGGVSSIVAGQTAVVSTVATAEGIPITNVANGGTSFVGDIRISNTTTSAALTSPANYGPVAIFGQGVFGLLSTGFISGTLNGLSPVNCARIISSDPAAGPTSISVAAISVYGLQQMAP